MISIYLRIKSKHLSKIYMTWLNLTSLCFSIFSLKFPNPIYREPCLVLGFIKLFCMVFALVYLNLLLIQPSAIMASLFFYVTLTVTSKKPSLPITTTSKVSLLSQYDSSLCNLYLSCLFIHSLVYCLTRILSEFFKVIRLAQRCLINMCWMNKWMNENITMKNNL